MGSTIRTLAISVALAACSARTVAPLVEADAGSDGGAATDTPTGGCTPGTTASCVCPSGGVATQTCLPVGAFGPCACPTPVDAGRADVPTPTIDIPTPTLDVPTPTLDVPLVLDTAVPTDARPPTPDVPMTPTDVPPATMGCTRTRAADLLFVIDNSNSMAFNQATLARNLTTLVSEFATGSVSLHVGVVSTDLGTPGSTVPSCANSDLGDDGLLNPIRNGHAIRTHRPWTTAPAGARPARCAGNDPNQYPSFLTFDASTDPTAFRDDFVCNAYLSVAGCGLEQQLESAYRALVVHNPREETGNRDANAGFVRPDAVLGIVMLTDEEDGSVRDCRFAEAGVACTDAIGVFDSMSAAWASADLNLRFYLYTPGSAADPTWNLDRYLDPARPGRGFTSLKPGAPQLVVFGAIAGVPITRPRLSDGSEDWNALLGAAADGSDGYTAMSPEGPVSMRQRNMDPACTTRVVPACRREGSAYDPLHPPCTNDQQYAALPSRRVAQIVRRFDRQYGNGVLGSICRGDYSETISAVARRVAARFCP